MMGSLRSLTATILVVGLLGVGPPLAAGSPRVGDEAKFFSPAAIEKANQKIRQIGRDYDKDVLIETVPRIPLDLQPKYRDLGKRKFFVYWAMKRAEEAGIKGIYVLLCKTPGHLQIEVGRVTRQRAFRLEQRDQLVQKMLPLLDKADKQGNDAALLLALDTIESSLRASLGKPKAAAGGAGQVGIVEAPDRPGPVAPAPIHPIRPPEPGGISLWGWILVALAVFAGLWLLSALLRVISGARAGGGSGGGVFGSLVAGMFGEPGDGDFSGDTGGGGDFGHDAGDTDGGGDFGGGD